MFNNSSTKNKLGQQIIMTGVAGSILSLGLLSTSCKRDSEVEKNEKKLELVGYDFDQTGFFKAVSQDNLQALKIFKKNGFDLNATDLLGRNAAHVAAASGAARSLNFLYQEGVALDHLDQSLISPLMVAAQEGQVDAVDFLLKAKVPTQASDKAQKFALIHAIDASSEESIRLIAPYNRQLLDTALLYAADQDKALAVEPLVQYGASVYARHRGLTSLMIAASKGHADVVSALIQHGANAFAVSDEGKLARDYASNHQNVLDVLGKATADDDASGKLALEWSDEELADVVKNAMERFHQSEIDNITSTSQPEKNTSSTASSTASTTTIQPAKTELPTVPSAPSQVTVQSIKGKTLALKSSTPQALANSMSMATYAEKPLPIIMQAEEPGEVAIQDLRNDINEPIAVEEGSAIAMTGLRVKEIKKKIVNSKLTGGVDEELVTLLIEDEKTGQTREIYSGYESTAADAVAVVRMHDGGDHLIVRRGDTFADAQGAIYSVEDVNEREIVVENLENGEVTLLPLLGIKPR